MSIIKPFIHAHGLEVALEKIVIIPITEVVQQRPDQPIGDRNFEYRRLMWKGFIHASMFDPPIKEFLGLTPSGVAHRLWRDHVIERKVYK